MSKVVTLRIDEKKYRIFRILASQENRPLSNFIETATMRYIEEHQLVGCSAPGNSSDDCGSWTPPFARGSRRSSPAWCWVN